MRSVLAAALNLVELLDLVELVFRRVVVNAIETAFVLPALVYDDVEVERPEQALGLSDRNIELSIFVSDAAPSDWAASRDIGTVLVGDDQSPLGIDAIC